jgi:hypothetical protein
LRKLDILEKLNAEFQLIIKRGKLVKLTPAIIAAMFLSAILFGLIIVNVKSIYQTSSTFSSVGTFKAIGIGVYWDADLTRSVTALEWGLLAPSAQKSFTVYISNEGTLPLTLSMSTSNWNPPTAFNYLALTWSYNGQTIDAGKIVQVTLTLTVSESLTGMDSFNFDITTIGTYTE